MTLHINIAGTKYPDNGCDVVTDLLGHESRCLECPLSECIEDSPSRTAKFWLRHPDIRCAHNTRGWSVAKIAIEFNISERTVQRVLAKGREEVATCRN